MQNPYSPTCLLRLICLWLTLGLLLGLAPSLQAQAPDWQAALALSQAPTISRVSASATDTQGKTYLVGYFTGTLQLGGTTLISEGISDAFITKWNPTTGTFEWAQRIGGQTSGQTIFVAVTDANV